MHRIISHVGRLGDLVTGWRAAAMAAITGGPSTVWAVVNNETAIVFSGIVTGAFFAVWGVWNFGASQMLRTMHQRLRIADTMLDELRAAKLAIEEESARQRVIIAQLEEESGERKVARRDRPA